MEPNGVLVNCSYLLLSKLMTGFTDAFDNTGDRLFHCGAKISLWSDRSKYNKSKVYLTSSNRLNTSRCEDAFMNLSAGLF